MSSLREHLQKLAPLDEKNSHLAIPQEKVLFLLSLGVFVNFKHLLAIFACLCQLQISFCRLCVCLSILWVSLSTLNTFLPSLCVFVRLCVSLSTSNVFLPSLCVFARLCVVWVSLRYLDRPSFYSLRLMNLHMKSAKHVKMNKN